MPNSKLSDVSCKYGAPMGRQNRDLTGKVGDVKMHLEQVRLNSGGYDRGGAYWGLRMRRKHTRPDGMVVSVLECIYRYYVLTMRGEILIEGFLDAISRDDAKNEIRKLYPEARFFR